MVINVVKVEELLGYREDINRYIAEYLHNESESMHTIFPDGEKMVNEITNFAVRGGKRIRAILIIVGYTLSQREVPEYIIKLSSIVEHFQNWMLIHDDIIDNGTERRKGDTMHVAIKKRFSQYSESFPQLPVNLSIVLGDIVESYVLDILANSSIDSNVKVRILNEYGLMLKYTGIGQLLDITLSAKKLADVTVDEIIRMIQYKTAYYTVAIPLKIGAILGNVSKEKLEALGQFGINLGIAFQLLDDIFGAGYYINEKTDKAANDIEEGKKTMLLIYAYINGTEEDRKILSHAYDFPSRDHETSRKIKEIMDRNNSLKLTEELYNRYKDRAMTYLDVFNNEERDLLTSTVSLILGRKH